MAIPHKLSGRGIGGLGTMDASLLAEVERLQQVERYLRVITEFASNISSLNTIDELVWAIARHAVGRLEFVDCIVYLLNESGNGLVQCAAFGPKNPIANEIKNPIEIPIGRGIVGAAARSGQPELIVDTRLDSRYIIDDTFRLSELAVPLVDGDKVLGVIDSEHPDVGFFTQDHQQILTTIAQLVAPRISAIRASTRKLNMSQAELEARTIELEQTLADLTAAQATVEAERDRATAASIAKSNFISRMSHELRTPLTSILGYAQLLQRDTSLSPRQRKGIDIIHRSGRHLLTLINDILNWSKQDAHQLELQPTTVDVNSFIDSLVEMISVQTREKNLSLETAINPNLPRYVLLDDNRLRQALLNLLSNAVKFTDQGSIKLAVERLSSAEIDATEVALRFEVIDSGVGIPQDKLAAIFLPFEQAGSKFDRAKGTGLGLPISQQIITAMQSSIQVVSKPNRGSRFWFDLIVPLAHVEHRLHAQDTSITGYHGPRKRVLVVDDSSYTRSVLRNLLETTGIQVFEAADGNAAVTAATKLRPDLIVMDILMPGRNGIDASRRIRYNADLKPTPILAMSAHVTDFTETQRILSLCNGLITKPIDIPVFYKQIGELLLVEWIHK